MPFMKDKLKKQDEVSLEDMQEQIDEAETAEAADAAAKPAAEEAAETAPEEKAAADADGTQAPTAEELQAAVAKLQEALTAKDDMMKRLQADFENFRRRTRQEKEDLSAVVTQSLLKDLLPMLDNFERALSAENKDVEGFHTGVDMIYKQLAAVLKDHGLEVIATDAKFDPNFHQAVMRVQDPDKEDDTIAAELQKGYMVKGKVIRPSMVQVVSN